MPNRKRNAPQVSQEDSGSRNRRRRAAAQSRADRALRRGTPPRSSQPHNRSPLQDVDVNNLPSPATGRGVGPLQARNSPSGRLPPFSPGSAAARAARATLATSPAQPRNNPSRRLYPLSPGSYSAGARAALASGSSAAAPSANAAVSTAGNVNSSTGMQVQHPSLRGFNLPCTLASVQQDNSAQVHVALQRSMAPGMRQTASFQSVQRPQASLSVWSPPRRPLRSRVTSPVVPVLVSPSRFAALDHDQPGSPSQHATRLQDLMQYLSQDQLHSGPPHPPNGAPSNSAAAPRSAAPRSDNVGLAATSRSSAPAPPMSAGALAIAALQAALNQPHLPALAAHPARLQVPMHPQAAGMAVGQAQQQQQQHQTQADQARAAQVHAEQQRHADLAQRQAQQQQQQQHQARQADQARAAHLHAEQQRQAELARRQAELPAGTEQARRAAVMHHADLLQASRRRPPSRPTHHVARTAPFQESDIRLDNVPLDPETGRLSIGTMSHACQHCGALHFEDEKTSESTRSCFKFGMCCRNGKVHLPRFGPTPPILEDLLSSPSEAAQHFRSKMRAYNSIFQMASTGIKLDHRLDRGPPHHLRIQGGVYHLIGSLRPPQNETPSFAQNVVFKDILT